MNWITRCPACATVYKVVPDQLKLASGWLRCGHCQLAFDSTGLVLAWFGSSNSGHGALVQDTPEDQRVVIDELLRHEDRSAVSEVLAPDSRANTDSMSELAAFSDALSSFKPLDLPKSGHTERADSLVNADETGGRSSDTGSAVAQSATGTRGRLLAVCGLVMILIMQGIWSQRHAMATFLPSTAPGLQKICHLLGCEIRPWRQPDGIVIDSSNFAPRPGGFDLQWTVHNATALTLGAAALELKLQDAQDKVLVRRVFSASELGAPATFSPGQSWSGQLLIDVDADLPVTGYRLRSFYP